MNSGYKYVYLLVAVNIIPHIFDLPLWVVVASLTFLAWKWISDISRVPIPGKWGTIFLVGVCTLMVVNQYGNFFGDEASTATLLIMASLKTFEMRGYRDVMILTYLCYFLLMTKLISSQSIGMTVFMVADVLLITGFMMMYHSPRDEKNWRRLLRRSLKMSAVGIPLMAILFFAFPRFTANLWGKGTSSKALSGFSGQLNPGSISEMMKSDETAFRVYFKDGVIPPRDQLYWRGVALESSQGLRWSKASRDEREFGNIDFADPDLVIQEIFLEPHGQKWLFGLDWPLRVEFPEDKRGWSYEEQSGRTYQARRELTSREFYRVYSKPFSSMVNWHRPDPDVYLQVQSEDSPRARVLAFQIQASTDTDADAVKALLEHFANGDYRYSLSPGSVSSIDEFLFENKVGFCEHYASSFATLLRWAGIPARVILGYQGGSPSFLQDYYIVRQLDAHAWVEYWDSAKKTWQRVDPTSVVAPDRFVIGAENFNDRLRAMDGVSAAGLQFRDWISSEWRAKFLRWRLAFDQIEAEWTSFLIRYDFSYQQELFSTWGWSGITRWHLFAISLSALLILATLLSWRLAKASRRRSWAQKSYDDLCEILGRKGMPRRANEGPLAYRDRILGEFPEAQQELTEVFNEVVHFRYSPPPFQDPALNYSSYQKIRRKMKQSLKQLPSKSAKAESAS